MLISGASPTPPHAAQVKRVKANLAKADSPASRQTATLIDSVTVHRGEQPEAEITGYAGTLGEFAANENSPRAGGTRAVLQ